MNVLVNPTTLIRETSKTIFVLIPKNSFNSQSIQLRTPRGRLNQYQTILLSKFWVYSN
jgi:hypothetical protein